MSEFRNAGCDHCLTAQIVIGQRWQIKGRVLEVVSIHPAVIHSPAYARLRNVRTGRESGIQLRRLVRIGWTVPQGVRKEATG